MKSYERISFYWMKDPEEEVLSVIYITASGWQ